MVSLIRKLHFVWHSLCSALVCSQAGWLLGTLLLLLLALVRCPCHCYHSPCHQMYQFVIIISVISAIIIIPMTTIVVIMTWSRSAWLGDPWLGGGTCRLCKIYKIRKIYPIYRKPGKFAYQNLSPRSAWLPLAGLWRAWRPVTASLPWSRCDDDVDDDDDDGDDDGDDVQQV